MTKKHDIIWLDETDSTNREAARRISGIDNLSVLSAWKQTEGRGQSGNAWSSEPGRNLTFSIVLKFGHSSGMMPEIRACDQFSISEAAALSVVDLLYEHGIQAKIKWPNDIYAGDRKICGILIENSLHGAYLSSSIIGIGLNVNQTEFASSLPNPTSMALCLRHSSSQERSESGLSPELLLDEFMDIFKGYCHRYLNITGGLSRLRKLYLAQMWRINEPARFIDYTNLPTRHLNAPVTISSDIDGGNAFTGIIRGLTPIGNLLVEDCSEIPVVIREFTFKEIGYML